MTLHIVSFCSLLETFYILFQKDTQMRCCILHDYFWFSKAPAGSLSWGTPISHKETHQERAGSLVNLQNSVVGQQILNEVHTMAHCVVFYQATNSPFFALYHSQFLGHAPNFPGMLSFLLSQHVPL